MEFRDQVLDLLTEVAETNVIKENPDVELFEEGIIDSFQTVGLLLEIQNKLLNGRKDVPKQPFLIGTGGSTDLVNAVELGSQYENLRGKKMAFIVSPQWFTKHGLTHDNFKARISKGQLNRLFNQNQLSPKLKQRYAKRLLQFKDVENRPYLEKVAAGHMPKETQYLSKFQDNQLKKIEAIKSIYPLRTSPLSHIEFVA